jgi:hypothetical protein
MQALIGCQALFLVHNILSFCHMTELGQTHQTINATHFNIEFTQYRSKTVSTILPTMLSMVISTVAYNRLNQYY